MEVLLKESSQASQTCQTLSNQPQLHGEMAEMQVCSSGGVRALFDSYYLRGSKSQRSEKTLHSLALKMK